MTITHSSTRLVAVLAGVAVAASLMVGALAAPAQAASLTQSQISSIVSLLQSFGADAATIANVQASLNGQPTSGTGGSTSGNSSCSVSWTRDLQVGSAGTDVKYLQQILNKWPGTMVAASGAGSPGNETITFGPATKAAVMKFQTKYGITPVAGYFGAKSRAQLALACGGTSSGGGPGPVPTGPGLSISAAAQPANALAPQGASRIPFTTFTITNNSGSPVTVNNVTVQRTGFGVDANFSGLVLLDQNGLQIGTSKTLNSNHQANVGDTFTIGAGQSMTLTVAGNIATGQTTSGQIVSLQVVAVNTSAPVSGSLPINGASHTINTTLALGSVSTTTSSYDPGAAQTKNIGDTNVRVAGLRFTAGSAEDLKLYNIRFRQVGTASASDIGNVQVDVGGTKYPTTLDASGKYYTVQFPGGLTIAKGNSIDVFIQADISGSNAASRTIIFDIDKVTDVYFVGQTYGYGVAPSGTYTPWFHVYTTTINAGTATAIGKATEVVAQNIAANVSNQVLGGFVTDFKGEAVSITSLPITIATSGDMGGVITSISLVNENGAVVAGPADEAATCTNNCTVTFSDTVTFPTGRHIWTLKGKIPSGASSDQTVIVSTVPTNWGSPVGQTSGNTISITTGSFAMNTMTIKAATLKVAISTTPSSQNIVAGGQGVLFANVQLDASQSGEDVRISQVPLTLTVAGGNAAVAQLTSCQLYDGATVLNTGSNVISSLAASGNSNAFTLDNTLTISKGTVKTLALKCNVSSAVTGGTFVWTTSNSATTWTSVGVVSGAGITETFGNVTSGTMTVGNGSLTVTVDSSSPSYALTAAGSTGVTVGVVKLHATNEPITLNKLGLVLTNSGNASSSANIPVVGSGGTNGGVSDLAQVYIYDGATLLGTATFTDTTTKAATSTLTTSVTLPKDSDKLLTIKADLTPIGVGMNGGVGDVVKIDPLNAEGSGQSSGTTIKSGATAGVAGIQMFKSFPTISNAGVSCTNSNACNGTQQILKKFTITANSAGPVSIYQIAVLLSTSSASVSNLKLFAYTSGYESGPANISSTTNGQFGGTGTTLESAPTVSFIQTTPYSFTGTTYFELKGDVSVGANTSWNVNATVLGDAATTTSVAGTNANVAGTVGRAQNNGLGISTSTSNKNFVWSDNASTTSFYTDLDFFDGYYVPGLSSAGF